MTLDRRNFLLLTGAAAAVPSLAQAHHGWSSFETGRAYYVRGEVTYVRWGNPHSEVHLSVDETSLPTGFRDRELPQGADAELGRETLASARPYGGPHEEIRLVLASPRWMSRWGLERSLEEGETIEVLGFLAGPESQEHRPMMFWLEDGQGVWQQLTALPEAPQPAND